MNKKGMKNQIKIPNFKLGQSQKFPKLNEEIGW